MSDHKSAKKRSHQFSSSSDEDAKPDRKKMAEEMKKPSISQEGKLRLRIRDYLNANSEKKFIDIEQMAKTLHNKYQDYNRRKYKEFRGQVELAFNSLLQSAREKMKEDTKLPAESLSSHDEATKVDKGKEPETAVEMAEEPKSDFQRQKDLAKEVEKSLKNQKKPNLDEEKCKIPSVEKVAPAVENSHPKITVEIDIGNDAVKANIPDEGVVNKEVKAEKLISMSPMPPKMSPTPQKQTVKKKKNEACMAFKEPKVNFSDVAGMEETLLALVDLMIVLKANPGSNQRTVLLHGPPGCGKTLLANAIAGQINWPLLEVTATEIVSGVSGESEAKLRSIFEQASSAGQPIVLFMDEIEVIAQRKDSGSASRGMDNRIITQLRSCLDGLEGSQVLFLAATNGIENLDLALRSRFFEVAVGIPNEQAREQILNKLTKSVKLGSNVDISLLARNTPSYVGRDFVALIQQAEKMAFKRIIDEKAKTTKDLQSRLELLGNCTDALDLTDLNITMEDFNLAIKAITPAAKREGFATVPDVTWDDVGALKHVRKQIELGVLARVNHPEKAKLYHLEAPTGVLLCGPPGCGKTLVAKAVANQAGINFISVKGPELLNMYVGESEKAVRQVFQRAKNSAPCVIFFDEIDALCPKRTAGSDHSGSNRVVTQMLTEMDGVEGRKGVYIMAATNRQEIIDPAITRPGRLETILYVGLPDASERVSILNTLSRNGTRPKLAPDVDLVTLARKAEGFSGADLKALITKASELAFSEDISGGNGPSGLVANKHFLKAFESLNTSVQGKELKRYQKMQKKLERETENSIDDVEDFDELVKGEVLTDAVVSNPVGTIDYHEDNDLSKARDDFVMGSFANKHDESNGHKISENDLNGSKCLHKVHQEREKTATNVAMHADDMKKSKNNEFISRNKEDLSELITEEQNEEEDKNVLRYLPQMAVQILNNSVPSGTVGKILRQEDKFVFVSIDKNPDIKVNAREVEPFMPCPGEKAKLMVPNEPDSIFDVLKYDLNDDDAVIVKNLETKEVSTRNVGDLCRIIMD